MMTKLRILPENGGWLDQSAEWRHDLLTYLGWVAYKSQQSKSDDDE